MTESSGSGARPSKKQIAIAVSSALASGWAGQAAADNALEEITVTARKITENIQDIPQSIQVLGEADIKKGNLVGLDDYARFIPSLSYLSRAPGTAKLVFRGVSDGSTSVILESSAAMYLDEQPLTQSSNTPEPRMVDIQRVEALSGPQGTLYGASSQSGTLRVITNKPDPTQFEAIADATFKGGSDSESSYDISGVLNLPLADDKFAIRLVGYTARDGGFIDNVLGDSPGGTYTSEPWLQNDIGGADFNGGRIAAKWFINESWSATAGIVYQDIETTGAPSRDINAPDGTPLGDLQKVRFNDEYRTDEWTQFALTIEGDLGFAEFTSASSYFTRDLSYQWDNSSYVSYLRNYYSAYSIPGTAYQYYVAYAFGVDPHGAMTDKTYADRFAQEFRLSHQGEKVDWVAGLFYEKVEHGFEYHSRIDNYEDTKAYDWWNTYYGITDEYETGAFWHSKNKQVNEQTAVFGEMTYHLNDKWSFLAGGRYFNNDATRNYDVFQPGRTTQSGSSDSTSDFFTKLSARYHLSDDKMLYALYSEGYRNGGVNASRGTPVLPESYDPDKLTNYEVGFKSRWMDGRLQANIILFDMRWDKYQFGAVDPGPLWQIMIANLGDAKIQGAELALNGVIGDGWEAGFNMTVLNAETSSNNVLIGSASGTRLPITPELKWSGFLQYSFPQQLMGGNVYLRGQYSFTGDSTNDIDCSLGQDPGFEPLGVCYDMQNEYAIGDIKLGYDKDTWSVTLFVNNVTDERADIYISRITPPVSNQVTTNRPREIGISFSKRWGN